MDLVILRSHLGDRAEGGGCREQQKVTVALRQFSHPRCQVRHVLFHCIPSRCGCSLLPFVWLREPGTCSLSQSPELQSSSPVTRPLPAPGFRSWGACPEASAPRQPAFAACPCRREEHSLCSFSLGSRSWKQWCVCAQKHSHCWGDVCSLLVPEGFVWPSEHDLHWSSEFP